MGTVVDVTTFSGKVSGVPFVDPFNLFQLIIHEIGTTVKPLCRALCRVDGPFVGMVIVHGIRFGVQGSLPWFIQRGGRGNVVSIGIGIGQIKPSGCTGASKRFARWNVSAGTTTTTTNMVRGTRWLGNTRVPSAAQTHGPKHRHFHSSCRHFVPGFLMVGGQGVFRFNMFFSFLVTEIFIHHATN